MKKSMLLHGVLEKTLTKETRLPVLVTLHHPFHHVTPCSGEIIEPGSPFCKLLVINISLSEPFGINQCCVVSGYLFRHIWLIWIPIRKVSGKLEQGECGSFFSETRPEEIT